MVDFFLCFGLFCYSAAEKYQGATRRNIEIIVTRYFLEF